MRRAVAVALGIAWLAAWVGPLPSGAQSEGPTYIVQEGDTLIAIADRFGSSLEEIATINGLADPSRIYPGMELVIPGFPGIRGTIETRQVQFGETLESLGRRYRVPTEAQTRLNRVVNPERVYAGEPWVVPVSEAGESGVAFASAGPGRGLLQVAAATLRNPWRVAAERNRGLRRWLIPEEAVPVPISQGTALAIPYPAITVGIDPLPLVQGRVARLTVHSEGDAVWEATWDGRLLPLHTQADGAGFALQGVHALAETGLVDVEIRTEGGASPAVRFRQPVRLVEGTYVFDPILSVPPETIDPELTGPEDELVRMFVAPNTPERLWQGLFEPPSSGNYTSRFGSRRNYNNTGYRFYHTGLDFSGREGTPILAPARGRVVFAGLLQVRGNTTIVDHGWGIYTAYLHQSEILVQADQFIDVGETIGLVGGTGRVTGPHLHWEVWVNGVPVDPLQWLEEEFP